MGKLTWQQLGMIYEGSFGVDPKEAAEILSDHLFNKGWVGNEKTPGRMWQDNETCAAFVWYLKEVEIYKKQNNLSFSKAVVVFLCKDLCKLFAAYKCKTLH